MLDLDGLGDTDTGLIHSKHFDLKEQDNGRCIMRAAFHLCTYTN